VKQSNSLCTPMRQNETEKTDKKDGEHAVSCINV
jgi:hypothetical protein